MKMIDVTGRKFGRLTVIGRSKNSTHNDIKLLCKCDCGNTKEILSYLVRHGKTQSCGCLNKEATKNAHTTHGFASWEKQAPEYTTWKTMKQRCGNPNNHKFKDYGGRGITICDSWKSFKNFIEDMGERPTHRHSIDRKDVNGNYEPSNCRWALPTTQARNIRVNSKSKSGKNGVLWNKDQGKWRSSIRVDNKNKHIGYYVDLNDAILAREEAENKYWQKELS